MGYIPSPHHLKVQHATRRLTKQVVGIFGRRASREIEVPSFRRNKRRFYLDLDKMHRVVQRRGCDQWVTDHFFRLQGRLADRINTELSFRDELKIQEGYYGYELRIKRKRPYVRSKRLRNYEYTSHRRNDCFSPHSS